LARLKVPAKKREAFDSCEDDGDRKSFVINNLRIVRISGNCKSFVINNLRRKKKKKMIESFSEIMPYVIAGGLFILFFTWLDEKQNIK
jgi:hypothetical protein